MTNSVALYRYFDSAGALLYVGISQHWPDRLTQHRRDKYWFTDIFRVELEYYPDRESALVAEKSAIQSERPQHNVVHNNPELHAKVSLGTALQRCWVKQGDVVALGMTGGRCPVGYVEANDGKWITLTLKDWLTGNYCGQTVTYRVDDIVQMIQAITRRDGVWQDECLRDFQTKWLAQWP